jgi:hypothetical protein
VTRAGLLLEQVELLLLNSTTASQALGGTTTMAAPALRVASMLKTELGAL